MDAAKGTRIRIGAQNIGWAKEGANLILHSSDLVVCRDGLTADLKRFHDELGDRPAGKGVEGAAQTGTVVI